MALIKCPECGKEISDKASACPNCGITMNDIKVGILIQRWQEVGYLKKLNHHQEFIT